jgi:hypothetical protein
MAARRRLSTQSGAVAKGADGRRPLAPRGRSTFTGRLIIFFPSALDIFFVATLGIGSSNEVAIYNT